MRGQSSFLNPFQLQVHQLLQSQSHVAAQGFDGMAQGFRKTAGLAVEAAAVAPAFGAAASGGKRYAAGVIVFHGEDFGG